MILFTVFISMVWMPNIYPTYKNNYPGPTPHQICQQQAYNCPTLQTLSLFLSTQLLMAFRMYEDLIFTVIPIVLIRIIQFILLIFSG